MKVILYDFFKKGNSTKQPTDDYFHEEVSNVYLKEDTSLYNPTFRLMPQWGAYRYNYLKWDDKYYFINDIVKPTINNCFEYVCTIDLLASYKKDIIDTQAYIKYCSIGYDVTIPDDRISFSKVATSQSATKEVFTNELETTITVQYISAKDSYYGSVATAILTPDNLRSLNALLMSESFGDSLAKQLDSTASAIVGCKLFPVAINADITGRNMNILGVDTNISCGLISGNGLRRGTWTLLTLDNLKSDTWVGDCSFNRSSPYTTYKLYLPCYGYIDISFSYLQELVLRSKSFDIQYIIDIINGSISYVIWGIGKFDSSFSVNIPTAYSGINALNTISSGIEAGGGLVDLFLLGGSVTDTAKAQFNVFVSSQQKVAGTIGSSSGSMASITADPLYHGQKDLHIELIKTTLQEVKNIDSTSIDTIGRPFNKVDTLKNHGGYIQTVNASCYSVSLPKVYLDELNGMLDSGIYIE